MIIGLVGLIGSGKGTVASSLVHGHGFKQDSFASSLKDACSVIFDWPRHMLEGDTKESREWREVVDPWWAEKLDIDSFSPRLALQLVGTNSLRNHFHEDIWFLSLANRIRKNASADVVVSDARFPNELDFIRENNGIVVRIHRGPNPEWYPVAVLANCGDTAAKDLMMTKYSSVHFSEWAWAGCTVDYHISNDGTLADLTSAIEVLVSTLKQGNNNVG